MNAKWMIAVASLAIPAAVAQTTAPDVPKSEESKISEPAETSTKGKAPAAPVKLTPEQEKIQKNSATGNRDVGTYKKKTEEEKLKDAADAKAKRTGVSPEDQEKQKKSTPGGS
jgi:hypothetical protein